MIPGEPRLHWTRQQFSAIAKSSRPLNTVLALMGHLAKATTRTNSNLEYSKIGIVYPTEMQRILAVADELPDETKSVVVSSKVGGRIR